MLVAFTSSHLDVFCEKGVLTNFAKFKRKHLCQKTPVLRPQACNFIKKEIMAHAFSCEFCEIYKSTFFYKTPPVAVSTLSVANEASGHKSYQNYVLKLPPTSIFIKTSIRRLPTKAQDPHLAMKHDYTSPDVNPVFHNCF